MNRRGFLRSALASSGTLLLPACDRGKHSASSSDPPPLAAGQTGQPKPSAAGRSREETLARVDSKADYYMRLCHNCAQSSFLTLHEVFGLGDASLARALTPMPGIAERGETCGAVVGSLLAIGFVYGRERLDDWAGWRACLVPARRFCEQFVQQFGSTQCGDVVEKLFGRRYNLADPAELGQFQEAGPTEKCGRVVRTAVRLAATLILDKR